MKNVLATKKGIIGVGIAIGILASLLQYWGNPANMGICVACFVRDITGAIGLHRAPVVQYLRPAIIGFVLGSFIAAYAFKEFRSCLGSAPLVLFILGVFAMIGVLIFLGCPWRAILRLAGGCPGRQFFLSGEGDAAVFVIGMIVGAGFAHNFGLACSGSGATRAGMTAFFIGLISCLLIGFTMRETV